MLSPPNQLSFNICDRGVILNLESKWPPPLKKWFSLFAWFFFRSRDVGSFVQHLNHACYLVMMQGL